MTPTGPKLIEINARMGGFYLRDWIKHIYGVDLMFCAMQIASGITPFIPKVTPRCHMMGVMLIPSVHRHFLEENSQCNNVVKGMHLNGDIVWNQFDKEVPEHECETHEEPIANIAVSAEKVECAKRKLLSVCGLLGINSRSYSVDYFIKHF